MAKNSKPKDDAAATPHDPTVNSLGQPITHEPITARTHGHHLPPGLRLGVLVDLLIAKGLITQDEVDDALDLKIGARPAAEG
jgi:hypothetical protein